MALDTKAFWKELVMQPTTQGTVKVSLPTKEQVIHSIERVALVFVTVTLGVWIKSPMPFSKDAAWGAALAGSAAVYQAVLSLFTSL